MLQSGNKRKEKYYIGWCDNGYLSDFSFDQFTFFQELLSYLLNILRATAAHVITSIEDFVPRYEIDKRSHVQFLSL
jgi:hypothetical protein